MTSHPEIEMPKHYQSAAVEAKWYCRWEEAGCFASDPDPERRPYTIVIPPPNVTGILHMGHALNNTLQDILIRAARMQGRNALWVPGTDHAGIATQNVVERELLQEGIHREDLGREAFLQRVWAWKEKYGSRIIEQLKRLGASCDWRRTRFTMDEGLSRAVREVFVRLYQDGLIYRGRRLIHWCVRCHTALADDEIEHEEKEGNLWYIRYPIQGRRRYLVVATTRPETMLGDTAVAVHPEDERYSDLVGQTVILPVMNRPIPIVADPFVDPSFGTGVVKVTPAHDPNDYECGQRHQLPQIMVIGPDGKMTEEAGKYAGLDRFRCRERLVEELKEKNLLEKTETHLHAVGHCYRCQSIVEPYLSEQWFVRMRPLAEKAIAATKNGKVRFHPARWERVYLAWLENVRDWCISRQIWWGHRIPVWYCHACGEMLVTAEDPSRRIQPKDTSETSEGSSESEPFLPCPKCGASSLEQDPDVLDTWFSSALWPFSTLGWPEETKDLAYYYPTDVLVTDRGIIYFWVARMVMMGLHVMGREPFSDVYIHGTILDEHGAKMSKSKGNGIDPLVMIEGGQQERFGKVQTFEGYGADAVRFTLAALTTEGQDIRLSPTRFEMGRNFINKVWNASRFVLMNLATLPVSTTAIRSEELRFEDRWILSRLSSVIEEATRELASFRYSDYTKAIYDFTWRDYCDWYLEMVKERLRRPGRDAEVAGRVLAWVLDQILRLLHPIAPFFTEEIWSLLAQHAPQRGLQESPPPPSPFLMLERWPEVDRSLRQEEIENVMSRVQDVVRAIRNIRAKFQIPPKTELSVVISAADEVYGQQLASRIDLIQSQAGVRHVDVGCGLEKPKQAAAEVLDGAQVFVPLAGFMDVEMERKRVAKELEKKKKAIAALNTKLRNEEFLAKAPREIIERETARKEEMMRQLQELEDLATSLGEEET